MKEVKVSLCPACRDCSEVEVPAMRFRIGEAGSARVFETSVEVGWIQEPNGDASSNM